MGKEYISGTSLKQVPSWIMDKAVVVKTARLQRQSRAAVSYVRWKSIVWFSRVPGGYQFPHFSLTVTSDTGNS